ncbi:hypothetical protein [Actinokineospora sp.]|uniref:hypothetical protein n=1 Tax=Actinokineospora sp. TaxID=1872133 RepID=UPI003D6A2EC6
MSDVQQLQAALVALSERLAASPMQQVTHDWGMTLGRFMQVTRSTNNPWAMPVENSISHAFGLAQDLDDCAHQLRSLLEELAASY